MGRAYETHTHGLPHPRVVNVSVWESEEAAKQIDKLAAMLAQRPILEAAGVTFDRIANYKPLWKIEKAWAWPERD